MDQNLPSFLPTEGGFVPAVKTSDGGLIKVSEKVYDSSDRAMEIAAQTISKAASNLEKLTSLVDLGLQLMFFVILLVLFLLSYRLWSRNWKFVTVRDVNEGQGSFFDTWFAALLFLACAALLAFIR